MKVLIINTQGRSGTTLLQELISSNYSISNKGECIDLHTLSVYKRSIDELKNINGVGDGKARKFGFSFLKIISEYVEENQITRPEDLIIKSTGTNSSLKLFIIQSIDRKLLPIDIANAKGLDLDELIKELEKIIFSGTKLNIDYMVNDVFDEDQQEELYDFFIESDSDDIHIAVEEFDNDYEESDLRLYRLKFINDLSN